MSCRLTMCVRPQDADDKFAPGYYAATAWPDFPNALEVKTLERKIIKWTGPFETLTAALLVASLEGNL